MRIACLLIAGLCWSSALAKEEFHQVDFTRDEAAALYHLPDNVVQVCKFEWCFDQPTATGLVVEMKSRDEKKWAVLSRTKEARTRKSIATVLIDPRASSQLASGKFVVRCGWGFEEATSSGKGGGWGGRDMILPGDLGVDFQWKTSPTNPEEMFTLVTHTAVYRIRLEKTEP